MSKTHINLIKLCVGIDSYEDLETAIALRAKSGGGTYLSSHITRMWPKQEDALLNGGSLYWVIKGFVQARQNIVRLDEVTGADGVRRCAILMEPKLIRTSSAPRRPFQGWRYLKPEDAPSDLPDSRKSDDALPKELALALADIGLR